MKSFGITDIGKARQYNQDYSLECDEPIGNLENLYVVCDGLGGRNAGEYASEIAAENFFDIAQTSEEQMALAVFKEATLAINALVFEESKRPEYLGMATTLVACTVVGDSAYFVNVGDSRGYIFGKEVTQVTCDHSYVSELVRRGQITKDEARTHSRNNIITRAIGAEETVEPDYYMASLEDDEIILLCSDGLYNMVSDDDLAEVICGPGSLEEKAKRLVDMANEAGGKDNIAVVLISK